MLGGLRAGSDLDVRGTTFTADLLSRLLTAFSEDDDQAAVWNAFRAAVGQPPTPRPRRIIQSARFDHAKFSEVADFDGLEFHGDVRFDGAVFTRNATFNGTRFAGFAGFERACFEWFSNFRWTHFEGAVFLRARFSWEARFDGAEFGRFAMFDHAQFRGGALFSSVQFADASFADVRFYGDTGFDHARFAGRVEFDRAQFCADADFEDVRIGGSAWFDGARFKAAERLGPLAVAQGLVLDGATFDRSVQVEASAETVSVRRTSFTEEVSLRLRYAAVTLDEVLLVRPLTLAAARKGFADSIRSGDLDPPLTEFYFANTGRNARPALLSMRGVDASRLVLIDMDLSNCQFADAYHRDQLRIEGDCRFADPPGWLRIRSWLPVWRYTWRQTLDEECAWRSQRKHPRAWTRRNGESVTALEPGHLAAVYRELRKAREDAKNEPGAADFYYGEMEMRRHAVATPAGERMVLGLYWALSGYGLRATRSLVALLTLFAATTIGFAWFGFAPSEHVLYQPIRNPGSVGPPVAYQQTSAPGPRPGWVQALEHSIEGATSLLHTTEPKPLTGGGHALEVLLRLLGPILLGLAALAVRNRVKR